MKFNTTYIPSLSLKATINELAIIEKEIVDFFSHEFKLTNVALPLFYDEDDQKVIDLKTITRPLNLDFAYQGKIGRFLLSPTNYLRNLINRLHLENNLGLIARGQFVFRDLHESPVSTVVKDEIIIQIKFDNINLANLALKNLIFKIYDQIFALAKRIEQKYQIKNIIDQKPYFISAQELELENPTQTPKEREITFAFERNAFWLTASGSTLYSGHIHTYLPPNLYDLKNHYQLIIRDRINSNVIKIVQIGLLANGIQLADQLALYEQQKYLAASFYQKLTKETQKIIEVKINVPRLAMALLAKGHLCEVQPGIISEESEIIAQKFNVEKY